MWTDPPFAFHQHEATPAVLQPRLRHALWMAATTACVSRVEGGEACPRRKSGEPLPSERAGGLWGGL